MNIPLIYKQEIPRVKKGGLSVCVVGLFADAERLSDIRRNRVAIMNEKTYLLHRSGVY